MIVQPFVRSVLAILLIFAATLAPGFADDAPRQKIRIATAAPSLSYFPIYAAVQKGMFAKRGFACSGIEAG